MADKIYNVLVVDDEEALCEALRFNLEEEGYRVEVAHSAEEALTLDLSRFDLFLLDIMMGEISGVQLARIIKSNPVTAARPIIFCTARDTEDDMVFGLDLGADDYIMKPYSIRAVSARVRAVLRRRDAGTVAQAADNDSKICYEGITMLLGEKQCLVDGEAVKLPRKEFEILLLLLSHRNQIFSRGEILDRVWPEEVVVLDRVVDVNITRIRQKLGIYGRHIVTRSGYGYGFMD